MKRAVVIASLSVFIGALALAQNKAGTEQRIKQMEQQVRNEVLKGDTAGLERLEADDYVSISGTGMMMDKNRSIQMLKDGSVKYGAIAVKEERVRVYGNTAIYNGMATVKLTVNGQDLSGDYRVTTVWAKLNGQWKRVSFQSTPVRP